jgi:hypothetical protein
MRESFVIEAPARGILHAKAAIPKPRLDPANQVARAAVPFRNQTLPILVMYTIKDDL